MPDALRFALVDVFAETPLTGNPAALVAEADDLTDDQLRALAREFNQSETTFVQRPTRPGRDARRLRSFTPTGEGGLRCRAQRARRLAVAHRVRPGRCAPTATRRRTPSRSGEDLLAGDTCGARTQGGPRRRHDGAVVRRCSAPSRPYPTGRARRGARAVPLGDLVPDRPARVGVHGAPGHLLGADLATGPQSTAPRPTPPGSLAALKRRVGGEGCYLYTKHWKGPSATPAYAGASSTRRWGIPEDPATGTAAGPLTASLVRPRTGAARPPRGHRAGLRDGAPLPAPDMRLGRPGAADRLRTYRGRGHRAGVLEGPAGIATSGRSR